MSKGILQRRAEIQGLATGILLPSVGVFGGPIGPEIGELGPLASVVGIGLFQRTVLTLQRAGIRQLIVLAGSEEEQLKLALGKGPRVTIPVRWMPIREFPLDDARTWESLASEVHGFALVASINGVFSRGLIEQLRRDVQEGQAIVVTQSPKRQLESPTKHGVPLRLPTSRERTVTQTRSFESTVHVAELVVVPASLMSSANQVANEKGNLPIRQWIDRAAADGRVRVVTADAKQDMVSRGSHLV